MERPLISGAQLAVLLCVCRLPAILFGLPGSGEEQIWAVLAGELIRLLVSLPVCILITEEQLPAGFFGGVFRFAAAACLIFSLGSLLRQLGDFAADTLYPGSKAVFFGAAMLLLVFYGAHMGLEAAARAALPVLILFGIGLLLTALGVREEIRLIQLRPAENISLIWKNGILSGLMPEELLIFASAGRKAKGKAGNLPALLWGLGLSAGMTAFASFLSGSVLGGLQRSSAYPFFRVQTLMQLSIFQRMDAWFLALWTGIIFLRGVFLLWSAGQFLEPYCGGRNRVLLPVLSAAALVILFLPDMSGYWMLLIYPLVYLVPLHIKKEAKE